MRTKTLLLTAAVGMVGMATSFAQVYSVNAVGYVNVTVPANGPFALLANPLNGTNNLIGTVLPLPDSADGTTLYKFNVTSQGYDSYTFFGGFGWNPGDVTLAPGEGFFLAAANTAGSTLSITFVGDVPQGHLVNSLQPAPKFAMVGSVVPQTAALGDTSGTYPTSLQFPAEDGDTIYLWDTAGQSYVSYAYFGGYGWSGGTVGPEGPAVPVATGFFAQKGPGTTQTQWVRDFSVN